MDNRQRECFEKAYDTAAELILKATDEFTEMFPGSASVNNFYQPVKMTDWTEGFWTGEVWLAYEKTGNEKLKKTAETEVENFMRRITDRIVVDHHDMGFLFSPSCVAAYKLTGNETGKEAALMAADNLLGRFQEKGQFVQAWGELGAEDNYRLIIDCLLNMPLLFWAGEVTGDPKYAEKAQAHIKTAMKCIIREDNSTYHTYFFDKNTGEPLRGVTHQGYRDGSAWARGQAWGVYGTAMAYRYTERKEYIEDFKHVTGYFLEHLPLDLVPYWDLEFGEGSDEPRDSSSASIAACGMLEMAGYMDQKEGEYYRGIARKIMKSVADNYAVKSPKESNGLVLHSTYSKKSPYNTCTPEGVDECNIWGDYFYMEALTRILTDWKMYW